MTDYVFDTDVPFPGRKARMSPLGIKCAAMSVGNSFVREVNSKPNFWHVAKVTGFNFRTREESPGHWRIWRVK